jgi:hypothetical protein
MRHVFDAHVYLFGDNAIANAFVHYNSERVLRHVEYASSLSVIVLVRHSLLKGSIAFDVNDVSPFVDF